MITDARYTDNIVLKREAYQELLTGIKHYPVIDVDYMEEWDTDDRTSQLVWPGYTNGSPCIKITYGDPQTTKGNTIFSKQFKKAINDLRKNIESLQNAIAARETYLDRLRKIYNDNNDTLIRNLSYLQAYTYDELREQDVAAETLKTKLSQLIQMMSEIYRAYPQTGEQLEKFSDSSITEMNFTEVYMFLQGTSWTTTMLDCDEDDEYFYMPIRYSSIIPSQGEEPNIFYIPNNNIQQAYRINSDGIVEKQNDPNSDSWTAVTFDNSNDYDMYVFQRISRENAEERKANESFYAKLYHDYDSIRVNIAIPLYRMAYAKYVGAGLGPNHLPQTADENKINIFYNLIVEFMNSLEAYEINYGFYSETFNDNSLNPGSISLGQHLLALSEYIYNYINDIFIQELKSKIDVTADHYNIYYRGGTGKDNTTVNYKDSYLGMQEHLIEVEKLVDVYQTYVNQVASGEKIINPNWEVAYNDGLIQWYEQIPINTTYDTNRIYYTMETSDNIVSYEPYSLDEAKKVVYNTITTNVNSGLEILQKDGNSYHTVQAGSANYNSSFTYVVKPIAINNHSQDQSLDDYTWNTSLEEGLYIEKNGATISDIDINRIPGVIDNDGSAVDRRMFGYKYIPVGNEISFINNLLGVNYNPDRDTYEEDENGQEILKYKYPEVDPESPQRNGTFRTTINGHTYEIGIRGLEQSDEHDINIIASNYEQVQPGTLYNEDEVYYYLDNNGNYVLYSEDIHGPFTSLVNAGRLFTKNEQGGTVNIIAGDEIKGEAPLIDFGGDNINLGAKNHINQSAGEEITIDAPVVNINGQENLNLTSINNFSYDQVPEGTPYDPNEKYYQQDENGKYIPYIYDPDTWAQDVADGKVYIKFLGEGTPITYGDINILGQDVYVRDPNDDKPIEERGLGKIHAVADYAVYDDSEYYIIDTNKVLDNLHTDAQGRYLIPIESLTPKTPKEGYMIKTPDPENAYFLISGIIDGDKTDENTEADTCVCIYLGNNITPTAINNKFIRLDGKNLPFIDNNGNIVDANGNIIPDENTPDIIKYLNKFLTGRYVRITGDTMTGELIINLQNTNVGEEYIEGRDDIENTTTLEKQYRNITELRYNEDDDEIKNSITLTLDDNILPININSEEFENVEDSIDPTVSGVFYVKPIVADTTEIINNYNNNSEKTTLSEYQKVGVITYYDTKNKIEKLKTYSLDFSAWKTGNENFHIWSRSKGYKITFQSDKSTKFTAADQDTKKFTYNNFLIYEKLTPHSSYRIYNPNASRNNSHIINVLLSNTTVPIPEYTITGIDAITQMNKSTETFDEVVNTADAANNLKFTVGQNTKFNPKTSNTTNVTVLSNACKNVYSATYFGDASSTYKIMPLNYTDVKIEAYADPLSLSNNYPYTVNNSSLPYPTIENRSFTYLGNNDKEFALIYQPVYYIYWGREYVGTDNTYLNNYPHLSFLDNITMTYSEEGIYTAPIYNVAYDSIPEAELQSLYYLRRVLTETDDEGHSTVIGYEYVQYDFTQTTIENGQVSTTGKTMWEAHVLESIINANPSDLTRVCKRLGDGYHVNKGIELKDETGGSITLPSITFINFLDKYKVNVKTIDDEIDLSNNYYWINNNNEYELCNFQNLTESEAKNYLQNLCDDRNLYIDSEEETAIQKLHNKIESLQGLYPCYKVYAWQRHYDNYIIQYSNYLLHKDNIDNWDASYPTLLELEKSGNFIKANFNFVYEQVFKITHTKLKNLKDFVKTQITIPTMETVLSIKNSYTGSLPDLLTYTDSDNFKHYFSYYDENYPNDVIRNVSFSTPNDYFIITATRPKIIDMTCRKSNGIDVLGSNFSIAFNEDDININLATLSDTLSYENFYTKLDSNKVYKLLIKQINLFDTFIENSNTYQQNTKSSFIFNTIDIANNINNKTFLPYEIILTPKDDAIEYSENNPQFGLGFNRNIYENYIDWSRVTYKGTNIADVTFNDEYQNYNTDTIHSRIQHYVPYYYHEVNTAQGTDVAVYDKDSSKFIYKFNSNNNTGFKVSTNIMNNSITSTSIIEGEEGVNYKTISDKALEVFNGRSEFNSYVKIDLSSYDVTEDGVKYGLATNQRPVQGASALQVNGAGYFTKSLLAARVYNAVFNDYAECRTTINLDPGHAVIDMDDGSLKCTTKRLQPGAQIISDTYGTSMGETETTKTPLAVAGRVLAYPYRDRNEYHAGMAVCSAPNGTVDIMTREEIKDYPDCIIGIVSEIPNYKTWGTNNVEVNNRIWIKVK